MADTDVGNILKTTGMTLLSSVGGASGPLWHLLMRAGAAVASKEELVVKKWSRCFRLALKASFSGAARSGVTRRCTTRGRQRWMPCKRAWPVAPTSPLSCGRELPRQRGVRTLSPCKPGKVERATWASQHGPPGSRGNILPSDAQSAARHSARRPGLSWERAWRWNSSAPGGMHESDRDCLAQPPACREPARPRPQMGQGQVR